jgi:hypothetical protein
MERVMSVFMSELFKAGNTNNCNAPPTGVKNQGEKKKEKNVRAPLVRTVKSD